MPHYNSVAIPWRLKKYRYMFIGTKCVCGTVYYPPRKYCLDCGNTTLTEIEMPNKGVIISFTKISVAPEGFKHNIPYTIGLVKLDNNIIISSHIVGEENKIKIGAPVKTIFRSLNKNNEPGVINYTTKFEVI